MRVVPPEALGPELQELKEAVCDALVNLTVERVSGGGVAGEVIFAKRPARAVVSGHLLPRYDEGGEDESSDIRLSTLGIDLEVHSAATGQAVIRPAFSTYVRILPEWDDLADPSRCGRVQFRLDRIVEAAIDAFIRTERPARLAAEGLNGRAGDDLDQAERDARNARRREIGDAVKREAYGQYGIVFEPEEAADRGANAAIEDAEDDEAADEGAPEDAGANQDPDAPPQEEVRVRRWTADGRSVPHALLEPAEIPLKWRRLDFELPPLAVDLAAEPEALSEAAAQYSQVMRRAALDVVRQWFASPAGLREAWRPSRVMPDQAETREGWEQFLTLARATPVPEARLIPSLDRIDLTLDRMTDFLDPERGSLRVTLENNNRQLGRRVNTRVDCIFLTSLSLDIPRAAHAPLRLDRVEPSYRFRHYLEYPGMGLNCGVTAREAADRLVLATTWTPRFVQPRIQPRYLDMPTKFARLAAETFDPADLLALPRAYRQWVDEAEARLAGQVGAGLSPDDAAREDARLAEDLAAQRAEADLIERGVQLLLRSRLAATSVKSGRGGATAEQLALAAPWRAWRLTNLSFLRRQNGDEEAGWRLFQLAFVLAHLPVIASRMPAFHDVFDAHANEETASLLYFPTGGGKSEAFYGVLIFNLFLDRLRGKNRGVSALVRYPLRLLTLQQAQRFLKLLIRAELVRQEAAAGGMEIGPWPFEIGFWVGGTNTPNRFAQLPPGIPWQDSAPDEGPHAQQAAYVDAQEQLNKIPRCPCCGSPTGLRRLRGEGIERRVAIICFNARCVWVRAKGAGAPLPFLLTDDAIYARAPSVILGTVDKMALLGQHVSTIAQVLGMFGLARWLGPDGGLKSALQPDDLQAGPAASGFRPIRPAYHQGETVFHDPFPSLIIQDEAHLLEESLGAFSGLFETLFEQMLSKVADVAGDVLQVARWPSGPLAGRPRSPKVIAATATVSEPARQLEALYQRRPLRFPYPGPDLYESFFAHAAAPTSAERRAYAAELEPWARAEATAPWSRLYVSLMTNGATHTVTAVATLSAFHVVITEAWRALQDPDRQAEAVAALCAAVGNDHAGPWRRAALEQVAATHRFDHIVALLDLHRIALTYVTNKKGGDQIMDALEAEVRREHTKARLELERFSSELISGGVNMQEIQRIMELAEARSPPDADYPDITGLMRSVVATSAISHGVDVDRFNSMFFAGLPSDIAEYIQASSRVGRTHVGFVMLIPTPQSRQDRFVVETHDIFHRFLERMIAPPALERWAEHAVRRVLASVVQAWAMLKEAEAFVDAPDAGKAQAPQFQYVSTLSRLAQTARLPLQHELTQFLRGAVGLDGRGTERLGRPTYDEMYRDLLQGEVERLVRQLAAADTQISISDYWTEDGHQLKPPMTSLRDVDEAGVIGPAYWDPRLSQGVPKSAMVQVMRQVRRQRGASDIDAMEVQE